ncbi:MAG: SpoIIE family protein phosphatase [Sphingobacteriaceae bacterium]|nr:SpoIIE family protein phosphatase [Sphingobacteriaceae bacterium]
MRQKQKDNKALEQMNSIISDKSKIVEAQHKDITDSIKYAERIQTAILPPDKLWKEILPNSFVYYRPKDILSGDFYWVEETKTHVYIAAADCTGHGVPGALVSIINYNLLNKAVLEKNLTDPAQILNQVNEWLTQALHQSYNEASMRDGMDVSICTINKKQSSCNLPAHLIRAT